MVLTTFTFLVVLSVLVLVHEGGHFLAAKKAGVKVEEFGFGYPPKVFGKKIGGTLYSLNLIPFGGFVRLYGEELEDIGKIDKDKRSRAFWAKSKISRTGIILAGVIANFILSVVCFSTVYSVSGIPTKTDQVKVVGIVKDSPAEKTGIKEDDVFISIDERKVQTMADFVKLINEGRGRLLKITVERERDNPCEEKVFGGGMGFSCQNGRLIFFVTPREKVPEGEGPLGVVVSDIEMKKYPFWQMPFRGTIEGFKEAWGWGSLIVVSLKKMLVDLLGGVVPKDVSGPIGIFQATSGVAKSGFLTILQFIGILSVNLAIINVLPLPALDGGRLTFILYEAIIRKRPKPQTERLVNSIGIAFLLLLTILVTLNDLERIFNLSSLVVRIRSRLPF